MWYENNEDENPRKTQSETDASAALSPEAGAAGHAARVSPAQADPTRAFEEDSPVSNAPATADEVAALKTAIKELDEKASINYDRYLRALAELENYKKRVARERLDQMRYASEDLLREILPVVDNLERTIAHSHEQSDVNKVLEGVEMIRRQFLKALEKSGISVIDQAPAPFDPTIHQALERVLDNSHPDDTVLDILQKGYSLNGKIIRPAMVRVAKHH